MADKHYKMKVTLTDETEFVAGEFTAPQGPAGAAGPSAYEVAVENGFKGTESEWLESLKGGPQGVGISNITFKQSTASGNIYTITMTDGSWYNITAPKGDDGEVALQYKFVFRKNTDPTPVRLSATVAFNRPALFGDMFLAIWENTVTKETFIVNYQVKQFESGGVAYCEYDRDPVLITGPQGIQGPQGEPGDGLEIKKWYTSTEEMNADYSNPDIAVGDCVAIDNILDLYVKGASAFESKGTLKGAKGDKGATGATGADGVSITGATLTAVTTE